MERISDRDIGFPRSFNVLSGHSSLPALLFAKGRRPTAQGGGVVGQQDSESGTCEQREGMGERGEMAERDGRSTGRMTGGGEAWTGA